MEAKMKRIVCAVLLLAVLIGCAQPPENLPRAQVEDVTEEVMEEPVEEPMETPMEDSMAKKNESMMETNESMMEKNESMTSMEGVTEIPLDMSTSMFEFEGYGPGKSHLGTFGQITGVLLVSNAEIVGAKGTIDASSVSTGIGQLDQHLQSDDFFDVAMYPTIEFESTSLKDGMLNGLLTFRGVQKELSIPVNATNESITGEFLLDVTPFNFKYVGINKDVRVKFDVKRP